MAKKGRPDIEIDLNEVKRLSELGLTQKDIAYILGIHPDTISRHKKKDEDLSNAIAEGKASGKQSLIVKMHKLTDGGNNKFVATKYLLSALHGVSETSNVDVTTKGESINKIDITVKGSKSTLLDKL